jgi:hypothetical protein
MLTSACWACGYVGNAPLGVVHISTGSGRPRARSRASRRLSSAQWRGDILPIGQGRHGVALNGQVQTDAVPHTCRARMPGQYSTRCGRRPCLGEAEPEAIPGRLFLCARCRAQVLVCPCCDRGQTYCAGGCAQEARHQAQRAASRRYQATRRGRVNHAARSGRWRARQKNVTHQGSPPQPPDDLVLVGTAAAASKPPAASRSDVAMRLRDHRPLFWGCHWCGRRCPPFVRTGFLRRRRRGSSGGQTRRAP